MTSLPLTRKFLTWNLCSSTTSLTRVRATSSILVGIFTNRNNSTAAVHKAQPGWRRIVAQAVLWGIPTPAFSTALAFFDGYRSEIVPANLLQAQRDYFGAHTFRVLPGKENDKFKPGQDIHVNWTGRGGNVSASTYNS